jgi:hypothetical protein
LRAGYRGWQRLRSQRPHSERQQGPAIHLPLQSSSLELAGNNHLLQQAQNGQPPNQPICEKELAELMRAP